MPTVTWKKYGELKDGEFYRLEVNGDSIQRTSQRGPAMQSDRIVFVDDPKPTPEPLPTYVPDGVYCLPWTMKDGGVVDSSGYPLSESSLMYEPKCLIAAAPDLYNACKHLVIDAYANGESSLRDKTIQSIALAREAITKAEGNETEEITAEAKPEANEAKPKKAKTEYKVVWFRTSLALEEVIKDRIAEGWVPVGGVSVSSNQDGSVYVFAQAITKTTEE